MLNQSTELLCVCVCVAGGEGGDAHSQYFQGNLGRHAYADLGQTSCLGPQSPSLSSS